MTKLFGHSIRSELLLLCVAEMLACFGAFYAILRWGAPEGLGSNEAGIVALAALLTACAGLVSGASGLYQPDTWLRTRRLLLGTGIAGFLLLILTHLAFPAVLRASSGVLPWRDHFAIVFGFAAAVMLTRLAFVTASHQGFLRRRLVLVQSPGAEGKAGLLTRQDPFFAVTLTLPADESLPAALPPARLQALGAWAVIADDPASLPAAFRAGLADARVRLLSETEFSEQRLGRIDLARLPADWLATVPAAWEGRAVAALRRGFDLVAGLALLLLTLPVLLVTMLAIRLDSPGPIFYRQERVGRGGRTFSLLKFRSMVVDAEAGGAPRWATQHDPRVTRVGRFLRLTRIDEIPQVLNVLRGDMAFVGPRPERPAFVEQLAQVIPHYNDRALVKPGITGWAQVNYPYGASVEDARMKLAYDLYYIRRRSLFLDLLILVATVRVVLLQEGSR